MTDLALASMFTGAVIFLWGFRALRKSYVHVLFFKMHSRFSTWVFGFVSTICGFLMFLTGMAANSAMSPELVEVLAKSGLYIFGIGWLLALIMEGIDRVNWRIRPELTPPVLLAKQKSKTRRKLQGKAKTPAASESRSPYPAPASDATEAGATDLHKQTSD